MRTSGKRLRADLHSPAFAPQGHDAVLMCKVVELKRLDPGTGLDGRAGVAGGGVRVVEHQALEVVGPDGERPGARRAAAEVMSGVLHDEPEVEVPSKVGGELDLGYC